MPIATSIAMVSRNIEFFPYIYCRGTQLKSEYSEYNRRQDFAKYKDFSKIQGLKDH